ncbi:hypothetical protein BB559_006148 [Furculomyces boomerangus]|uniref:Reverse transcriptase domain-containing protein n=1 Tax=Furculomyces boomerangus TaxID=61424 RepID=A0A2T9Y4J6_9FUNG|nr:hypothetical protein BB559_006148 [Furculomyces boomerangus]
MTDQLNTQNGSNSNTGNSNSASINTDVKILNAQDNSKKSLADQSQSPFKVNPSTSYSAPSSDKSFQKGSGIPKVAPGSASAPMFKGTGIKSFIEIYEMITMENSNHQRTLLFPYYCKQEINLSLIKTKSYENRDWKSFKRMLIARFFIEDEEETMEDLDSIVRNSFDLDNFEDFIYKFEYISDKLESNGQLLPIHKAKLLLKSLSSTLLEKIGPKVYTVEGKLIKFKELVLLSRQNTDFRYYQGSQSKNSIRNSQDTSGDDIRSLIDKMSAMSMKIDRLEQNSRNSESRAKQFPARNFDTSNLKCAYCEGRHAKRDCLDLDNDLEKGYVLIGEKGMITDRKGVSFPLNFNRGGIKALVKRSNEAHTNLVTIETDPEDYGYLSENEEIIKEYDFVNLVNTFTAKLGGDKLAEKVQPYNAKGRKVSKPVAKDGMNMESMNVVNIVEEDIDLVLEEIYVDTSLQDSVMNKFKGSKIELTIQELASVSPLVRKNITDSFKVKREVITDQIQTNISENSNSKERNTNWKTGYLAVGSGKVIGRLQGAEVKLLFDEGSEINVMSADVYRALRSLGRAELDESLNWNLIDANQGSTRMMGVFNNLEVEIEGVLVRVPIFVSEHTSTPVIMGRPWDLKSRVLKDNRTDEADGRRYRIRKSYADSQDTSFSMIKVEMLPCLESEAYFTEVRTRYKSVNEKVNPVARALKETKSPSILERDKTKQSTEVRLTDARIDSLITGDGNLNNNKINYFKSCLKQCDKAFAFTQNEMGLLSESSSRDIFGMLTPFGLFRMTRLPMGWTNSVQIFQRLMYKIFMEFIPDKTGVFLDDGCIKGEVNPDNNCDIPGIRNFVKKSCS